MEQLVDLGKDYSVEVNTNKVMRKLAKSTKMSVDQWEKIRDKLVVINEQMQVDHLLDAIYEIAGDLTEAQEQVLDGFQNNTDELVDPVSAFHMLVQAMNLEVKRIAKTDKPVATEVYLPL